MRLSRIAVLGILICAPMVSAWAANGNVGFGSALCEGIVSCTPTPDQLQTVASIASNCAASHFGMRGISFDASGGLDGSQCLQSNQPTSDVGGSTGIAVSAHCCIIQMDDNTCHVQCQQLGSR